MDTSYLKGWDVKAEQQKADFMAHMYKCSGRTNGLYTGLWQDFCMNEAGPVCRDQYFERLKAIKHFEQMELQQTVDHLWGSEPEKEVSMCQETFVPTLHD